MAAPAPRDALFDIQLAQRVELPSDNGLLRPALTQSLEFDKVRARPAASAELRARAEARCRRYRSSCNCATVAASSPRATSCAT